jgi:hypothetical protein
MIQEALFIPKEGFGFVVHVPVPTPPDWERRTWEFGFVRGASQKVQIFKFLTWDNQGRPIYQESA